MELSCNLVLNDGIGSDVGIDLSSNFGVIRGEHFHGRVEHTVGQAIIDQGLGLSSGTGAQHSDQRHGGDERRGELHVGGKGV